jgi:hypothetical protein
MKLFQAYRCFGTDGNDDCPDKENAKFTNRVGVLRHYNKYCRMLKVFFVCPRGRDCCNFNEQTGGAYSTTDPSAFERHCKGKCNVNLV